LLDIAAIKRAKLDRLRIYAVVSNDMVAGRIADRVEALVTAGVDAVQLREKTMDDGPYCRLAKRLSRIVHKHGGLFFVNDRVHMCEIADADGLHVGQTDTPVPDARAAVLPTRIIGLSTHTAAEVRRSARAAPDYVAVGPIYETPIKSALRAVGLTGLRRTAARVKVPVVAIGSVTAKNAREVFAAGAHAVAMSRPMCEERNVTAMVKRLRRAIPK